jgi:hypothetical protein
MKTIFEANERATHRLPVATFTGNVHPFLLALSRKVQLCTIESGGKMDMATEAALRERA